MSDTFALPFGEVPATEYMNGPRYNFKFNFPKIPARWMLDILSDDYADEYKFVRELTIDGVLLHEVHSDTCIVKDILIEPISHVIWQRDLLSKSLSMPDDFKKAVKWVLSQRDDIPADKRAYLLETMGGTMSSTERYNKLIEDMLAEPGIGKIAQHVAAGLNDYLRMRAQEDGIMRSVLGISHKVREPRPDDLLLHPNKTKGFQYKKTHVLAGFTLHEKRKGAHVLIMEPITEVRWQEWNIVNGVSGVLQSEPPKLFAEAVKLALNIRPKINPKDKAKLLENIAWNNV
jgi:hypothetical protein